MGLEAAIQSMTEQRRAEAARLRWFDASLWLGRPQGFPLAKSADLASLRQEMADRFITGGLVSHWRGGTVSPAAGNEALDALAGKLVGHSLGVVVTALPVGPDGSESLAGHGAPPSHVYGLRVFPRAHAFPPAPWLVGGLCRWMIDHGLPLFVWHTETDWQELYALANAFPDLSVVIESQPRKIIYGARSLLGLLRECPNVFVEISNLTSPCFAQMLAGVGPERFVFGSFLPVNDPLVAIGMVLDTEMSEADRALIAGDNLRRLIRASMP